MNINLIVGFHSIQWESDNVAVFELTSCGVKLTMFEEGPSINIQLDKTYPILSCCTRTQTAKLVEIALNPNIQFLSRAKPVALQRQGKRFIRHYEEDTICRHEKAHGLWELFPGMPYGNNERFHNRTGKRKAVLYPVSAGHTERGNHR